MLPAAWAAWKGAGAIGKFVSIAAPVAILLAVFYGGRWIGHANGYEECQQIHDALAMKQATQVIEHTAKQAELPAAVLQAFIKGREEGERIRERLERKLRAYEQERKPRHVSTPQEPNHEQPIQPACQNPDPLDESFVRHWDAIGRMFLEETGGADTVPAADRDSGGVSGIRTPDLQTPTLLRARAAEFDEHKRLLDHYHGLREFAKGVYIFQESWAKNRQQATHEPDK